MSRRANRAKKVNLALTAAALLLAGLLFVLLQRANAAPAAGTIPDAQPESVSPAPQADYAPSQLVISELMVKNRATLRDESGAFPDWFELQNIGDAPVSLSGWRVSDKEAAYGWTLPDEELAPGAFLLLYADRGESGLHTDFALSEGETLFLRSPDGAAVSSAPCMSARADVSVRLKADGGYEESCYPTPGYANDAAGYEAFQASLAAPADLTINEVVVANVHSAWAGVLGESDWVELKNNSRSQLRLSDYCISDDADDLLCYTLPNVTLSPGERWLLRFDRSNPLLGSAPVCAAFNLDAFSEQLYLSRSDGTLVDYAPLRDIPYDGSLGRLEGKNGWFYFAMPSPGEKNKSGFRRVSAMPVALTEDGVFDDVDSVEVALAGSGVIRYTTDGSVPTENSPVWKGPLSVKQTGSVRAICLEEGALPSRVLTLCYILNEGHTLPVVSLINDAPGTFQNIYNKGIKVVETRASFSYYDDAGSFTVPCGIKMHGDTSLVLPKKNMSLRLRGQYGAESVQYDLFGGGVTEFSSLILRCGQDYNRASMRNELCEALAQQSSDAVFSQRSRYVVVYIDGVYSGIYALTERLSSAMVARQRGVSESSVRVVESEVYPNDEFYIDVLDYCDTHDLSDSANYEELSRRLDLDSVIDWIVLEGWCANTDLTYGNLRYCRSTEDDGRWRLMYYDMDATLSERDEQFTNILSPWQLQTRQVSMIIAPLLKNADFRDRLLTRAGELLSTTLADENVLREIDRLEAELAPEIRRDFLRLGNKPDSWAWNVRWLRSFISDESWAQHGADALCEIFSLGDAERERYFGGVQP